jgi:hypothetical protein
MANSVRNQNIWLPQGNADNTNISPTDYNSLGGQPGDLGQKFQSNLNQYQRVLLDSGATSATPAGAPAANDLLYWKDKSNYIVTNDRRQTMATLGLSTIVSGGGYRNFIAGVLRNAATGGYYIDALQAGIAISLPDGGNNFAVGETVIAEDDTASAVDRIAVGTAPTFQRIGIARGAATGGVVSVDVNIDFEQF